MNKQEDQKSHSNSTDVCPVRDLWTDGLICAFEFVRRHKKVLSEKYVVREVANKQVSSPELNDSQHSRKNINNSCESSPKRDSGIGQNDTQEGRNCNQDSHSGRFCGRGRLPKSCWVPIGWDRISELLQTVQVDDGWVSQPMDFADNDDDVAVADVAAPYWERPVGPTWWCHVAAGHPCVNSWLSTAQWLHPAVSIALRDESRLISDRMKHLLYEVPVRVASGLLFELLGQSAGDPFADEDDIPIVLRSWQAQNFLVTALHVKGSAQNINVLGITEVQELLAAEGNTMPRTIHEVIAHLACRLACWDDRLFRKSIFGAADEVELKFMNRRTHEDMHLFSIILNQEIQRLSTQIAGDAGGEEGTSRAAPRRSSKDLFRSSFLDLSTSRRLSSTQLITGGDVIVPITPNNSSSYANLIANLNKNRKRRLKRRSHSAPSVFTDFKETIPDSLDPRPAPKSTPFIVRQAFIGVIVYVIIGVVVYLTIGSLSGNVTYMPVDSLYFIVVTLCTIGYGDIVPDSTFSKLFTCFFILVGFGFIDILLHGLVTYICDRQESVLLSTVDENKFNTMVQAYFIDKEKGRMRIRMKVCLALTVVICCIAIGTIVAHYAEDYSWVDSFYLSVTSVTTVGYGDYAFKTVEGRCFAVVWLLVSTFAVARAFLYLTELRIDKRNRKIAKWVLQKEVTLRDLLAADLDNDGCISKSEFVLYKLREMGMVANKDILLICKQFDSLGHSNDGKITLVDLMEGDSD